jgi:hypothetical protein
MEKVERTITCKLFNPSITMSFCRPMVEFKGSKGNLLEEGGNTTIEGQNK